MTMSPHEVQAYVLTYLETLDCQIMERSPAHVTVKLSPEADKALTNRPYYWGFVERTGAPAETMSFTFVFDPDAYQQALETEEAKAAQLAPPPPPGADPGSPEAPKETILGRYFGIVPSLPQLGPGRILKEDVVYGSRRLQQIFNAAREGGAFVNLFEQAAKRQLRATAPAVYEPWLGVCFKVEFACDLKKEELHFIGISLRTGEIVEKFGSKLNRRDLSPRLAENMHVQTAKISLVDAGAALESHLTNRLLELDYSWAEKAKERLDLELAVVDTYYEAVLREDTPEVDVDVTSASSTDGSSTVQAQEGTGPSVHIQTSRSGPSRIQNVHLQPMGSTGVTVTAGSDVELAAEAEAQTEPETDPEQDKARQAVLDREAMKLQYETRRTEMIWQYEPKVKVTAISSGMFHLR
ncbi:YqhG family protein [Paenibacillus sp. UMB7766-LJ446]|uniref:YqhG family protein n=1 Tax=Paenibacillus sp. UMB7766-LJ446 TaxID=3046313 RepID=UPI00255154E2|nr:YqhG family protein [Paenibacillus sp. UMB7766-LJ446]MDK8188537.1 YqhG family protein [Paenibacillus sp. UMB7766-LJ446]